MTWGTWKREGGEGVGVWIIRKGGDRGMIARAATDERRNSKRPSVTKTFGRLCVHGMTSVKSLRKADNRVQDRLSLAVFVQPIFPSPPVSKEQDAFDAFE